MVTLCRFTFLDLIYLEALFNSKFGEFDFFNSDDLNRTFCIPDPYWSAS
jgi:hypothetical protein